MDEIEQLGATDARLNLRWSCEDLMKSHGDYVAGLWTNEEKEAYRKGYESAHQERVMTMKNTIVEVTVDFTGYREWYKKVSGQDVALKPTDSIAVIRERETVDYGEKGYHVIAWATYFVPTRFLSFGHDMTGLV